MVAIWWLSLAVMFGAAGAANGQDAAATPSPYFDCPYVNYFDTDCPQLRPLREEQARRPLQRQGVPAAVPRGQGSSPPLEPAEQDQREPHEADAETTYLLFPKESLAPDTPALFRLLLAEPTLENARRYVRWYARRTARLQAVQALIQLAGGEFEAAAKAGGE